jgi:hypothetical protein
MGRDGQGMNNAVSSALFSEVENDVFFGLGGTGGILPGLDSFDGIVDENRIAAMDLYRRHIPVWQYNRRQVDLSFNMPILQEQRIRRLHPRDDLARLLSLLRERWSRNADAQKEHEQKHQKREPSLPALLDSFCGATHWQEHLLETPT